MKRILKIMFCITLLAVLYAFTPIKNKNLTGLADVRLDNIEALSSGEDYPTACYGAGTIDCLGIKVEFKIVIYK